MDDTDRQIVELLEEDARRSFTKVAERIGVSEGTVRNRVERMQEEGVIEKFTVELGSGHGMIAFVMVKVATGADIEKVFDGLDAVIYEVAGPYDAIVKVTGEDSSEINEVVDNIRLQEGVTGTETFMVLNRR